MIYGYFQSIPLILVITQQNRKTLFCVFLRFRNLPKLKLTWDFSGVNILSREPSGAREVYEGGNEAQTGTSGMGPRLGPVTHCCLALGPLMPSIFVS
jgi:hypothetical protein